MGRFSRRKTREKPIGAHLQLPEDTHPTTKKSNEFFPNGNNKYNSATNSPSGRQFSAVPMIRHRRTPRKNHSPLRNEIRQNKPAEPCVMEEKHDNPTGDLSEHDGFWLRGTRSSVSRSSTASTGICSSISQSSKLLSLHDSTRSKESKIDLTPEPLGVDCPSLPNMVDVISLSSIMASINRKGNPTTGSSATAAPKAISKESNKDSKLATHGCSGLPEILDRISVSSMTTSVSEVGGNIMTVGESVLTGETGHTLDVERHSSDITKVKKSGSPRLNKSQLAPTFVEVVTHESPSMVAGALDLAKGLLTFRGSFDAIENGMRDGVGLNVTNNLAGLTVPDTWSYPKICTMSRDSNKPTSKQSNETHGIETLRSSHATTKTSLGTSNFGLISLPPSREILRTGLKSLTSTRVSSKSVPRPRKPIRAIIVRKGIKTLPSRQPSKSS